MCLIYHPYFTAPVQTCKFDLFIMSLLLSWTVLCWYLGWHCIRPWHNSKRCPCLKMSKGMFDLVVATAGWDQDDVWSAGIGDAMKIPTPSVEADISHIDMTKALGSHANPDYNLQVVDWAFSLEITAISTISATMLATYIIHVYISCSSW